MFIHVEVSRIFIRKYYEIEAHWLASKPVMM